MASKEKEQDLPALESQETPHETPSRKRALNVKDDRSYGELQEFLGLQPKTIVLAKVKGYRPWPAMVLDEEILPENIIKIKPKTVRLEKKTTEPVINVPVRFFSDDTYIWIKSCDLKLLKANEINTFLSKRSNQKKHDLLIDAYKLAQDPPDMIQFNLWGSAGEPDPLKFTEDGEPIKKKLKLSIKLSNGSKSTLKKSTNSKNTKPSKATPKKSSSNSRKNAAIDGDQFHEEDLDEDSEVETTVTPDQDEYDSDWGLDEIKYNYDTGDYIFEDHEDQENFATNFPRAADLASALNDYTKELTKIHDKIASSLIEEIVDDERLIVSQLRNLEKYIQSSELPLVLLTKSPLYKVLLLVLHRPKEVCPFESVRRAVKRIFQILDFEPCELTVNDVEKEEEKPNSITAEDTEAESKDEDNLETKESEESKSKSNDIVNGSDVTAESHTSEANEVAA